MGFWGCRSFDNDTVHDELNRAGRRGGGGFSSLGGLTGVQLEKYLKRKLQPLLMDEKEKRVQKALGSFPSLVDPMSFLGMVVWGLRRNLSFSSTVLDVAIAAGQMLYADKIGLSQWKDPKARKKRLAQEICILKETLAHGIKLGKEG